jgi:hypothetical protein
VEAPGHIPAKNTYFRMTDAIYLFQAYKTDMVLAVLCQEKK